jgi:hypothetical protein
MSQKYNVYGVIYIKQAHIQVPNTMLSSIKSENVVLKKAALLTHFKMFHQQIQQLWQRVRELQ